MSGVLPRRASARKRALLRVFLVGARDHLVADAISMKGPTVNRCQCRRPVATVRKTGKPERKSLPAVGALSQSASPPALEIVNPERQARKQEADVPSGMKHNRLTG
jgi:hypothetical protein